VSYFQFILYTIEHWASILLWSFVYMTLFFVIFKKRVIARQFDPFHIVFAFNLGTSYGIVTSLYQNNEITDRLFLFVIASSVILTISLMFFFKLKHKISFAIYKKLLQPEGSGKLEFGFLIITYALLSVLIVSLTGLGAFTETNRFEQAKGLGQFVRILDLFRLIILAYLAVRLVKYKTMWSKKKFVLHYCIIIFFLIFSSLLSGAKFAMLEGLYAISTAVYAAGYKLKLGVVKSVLILLSATVFAIFVLSLNIRGDDDATGLYSETSNPVLDRFANRVLSNGDSYFMSLPNQVIDELPKDNFFIRFLSQIAGISLTSKIVGYNAGDLSVGRAMLLYHDPTNNISGGPVSHYDLFAYVYFGSFAFLFIIAVAYLLSGIHNAVKKAGDNIFFISVCSALWVRCLQMIIEPPAGFAYIFDTLLIIGGIKLLFGIIRSFPLNKVN
jgi:hypothetical protein